VGNTLTATISSGSVVVADGGGSLTVDTSQLPTSLVSNRLDVNVGNTPSVTISSGTVSVSSGSVIVADGGGIISIDGTVTANQGTAAAQSSRWPVFISDGSAERVGQQTMANSIPVTIASNQSAVPVTVSSGSVVIADGGGVISVEGVIPHDSPASNIPVLIGASHETMADAVPDNRVTADGDVTRLSTTDGALFVIPTGPQTWQFLGTGVQTGAQVHAAPGPGLSLYVTDITFSIGAATASSIKILNNGGADIWGPHYLEAINGRGLSIRFGTPKKVSVNTRLDVTTTGAATQTVDIQGFTGPG